MREAKLKVVLLAHTPKAQQIAAAAIRQCYSAEGAKELTQKLSFQKQADLIHKVLQSGHLSTIEHISFTFAVEGISRACSHQLVRHRIASFSQQSQRYLALENEKTKVVIPPSVKNHKKLAASFIKSLKNSFKDYKNALASGIKPEDARFLLPQAIETKIVLTMNARSLLNFFQERLCKRAQWEIHLLAQKMLALVKPTAPELFQYAGPTCKIQKICWEEKMSCGLWKTIQGAILAKRVD